MTDNPFDLHYEYQWAQETSLLELRETLDKLGAAGWELVNVCQEVRVNEQRANGVIYTAFLNRRILA